MQEQFSRIVGIDQGRFFTLVNNRLPIGLLGAERNALGHNMEKTEPWKFDSICDQLCDLVRIA